MSIQGQRGIIPIGGTSGWLKSFTGVPNLATQGRDEWVEVNGATINDVESPLNGQTLPDLNASNYKFLRGNDTSGGTGGATTGSCCHCHTVSYCCGYAYIYYTYGCSCGYFLSYISISGTGSYDVTIATVPPYYDVVWIIRIK